MTTTHEDARLSMETSASRAFREVLLRLSPDALTAEAGPISLVALLDDGSLRTMASLGGELDQPDSRSIWSEGAWRALAREGHELENAWPPSPDGTILFPITVDSVLYGAIEWSGGTDAAEPHHVELQLAAAELAPLVEAAVRR